LKNGQWLLGSVADGSRIGRPALAFGYRPRFAQNPAQLVAFLEDGLDAMGGHQFGNHSRSEGSSGVMGCQFKITICQFSIRNFQCI
jgi:hypothetical protein